MAAAVAVAVAVDFKSTSHTVVGSGTSIHSGASATPEINTSSTIAPSSARPIAGVDVLREQAMRETPDDTDGIARAWEIHSNVIETNLKTIGDMLQKEGKIGNIASGIEMLRSSVTKIEALLTKVIQKIDAMNTQDAPSFCGCSSRKALGRVYGIVEPVALLTAAGASALGFYKDTPNPALKGVALGFFTANGVLSKAKDALWQKILGFQKERVRLEQLRGKASLIANVHRAISIFAKLEKIASKAKEHSPQQWKRALRRCNEFPAAFHQHIDPETLRVSYQKHSPHDSVRTLAAASKPATAAVPVSTSPLTAPSAVEVPIGFDALESAWRSEAYVIEATLTAAGNGFKEGKSPPDLRFVIAMLEKSVEKMELIREGVLAQLEQIKRQDSSFFCRTSLRTVLQGLSRVVEPATLATAVGMGASDLYKSRQDATWQQISFGFFLAHAALSKTKDALWKKAVTLEQNRVRLQRIEAGFSLITNTRATIEIFSQLRNSSAGSDRIDSLDRKRVLARCANLPREFRKFVDPKQLRKAYSTLPSHGRTASVSHPLARLMDRDRKKGDRKEGKGPQTDERAVLAHQVATAASPENPGGIVTLHISDPIPTTGGRFAVLADGAATATG